MKCGKGGRNFEGGLEEDTDYEENDKLARKEVEGGVTLCRGEQGRGFK